LDYENNATFNTTTERIQVPECKIFGASRGINRCTFIWMSEQLVLTYHTSHAITDSASCKHYWTIHSHRLTSLPFLYAPLSLHPSQYLHHKPTIFYRNDVARFTCVTTFLYGTLQRRWTFTTRFAFVFFMPVSPTLPHSHHPFYWNLEPQFALCSLIPNQSLFLFSIFFFLFYPWRALWPQGQCYCWLCVCCFRRWLRPFAQPRTLYAWRVASTVTVAVLVLRPLQPPTLLVTANRFLLSFLFQTLVFVSYELKSQICFLKWIRDVLV